MSIFTIIRVQDPAKMEEAIKAKYPDDNFKISANQWLVSAKGTSKEVSDALGITADDNSSATGPAIVFKLDTYYGRAPKDIWEWIRVKLEATNG